MLSKSAAASASSGIRSSSADEFVKEVYVKWALEEPPPLAIDMAISALACIGADPCAVFAGEPRATVTAYDRVVCLIVPKVRSSRRRRVVVASR